MKARTVFDRTVDFAAFLACGLIFFATLSVCFDVAMRFLVNRPQLWVLEIAEYILLGVTFLGAAYVLREEGHVKVEMVLSRLKPKTQAIVNAGTSIVGAIACLTLVRYSAQVTWELFRTGAYTNTPLEAPKFPLFAVIALGCFLFCLQFLIRAHKYIRSWRSLPGKEQRS